MPAMRTPLVGRRHELDSLQAQLDAAGEGHGRLVLLAGEPGIGKTRLLGELAERATARGWLVLAGRTFDGDGMPPYLPFGEAFARLLAGRSEDELRDLLGPAASAMTLLLPELRDRLPGLAPLPSLSPEHERYRLFESVSDVVLALAGATEGRGLLLTLDDLHWADAPSLLLLQHLARRAVEAPLLAVGSYRREDLGGGHPLLDLLATLRRDELGETLDLPRLADEEATLLLAQLAGAAPAPEVATAIQRQAEGNPFFLGELVRHLQSEGLDLTNASVAGSRLGLPEGVRDVIGRRLARLGTEGQLAIQCAAVLGDGLRFAELRELSGLEEERLLDALDTLLAAGMLREAGDGYQFGHALIRETAYAALSLARRERLHRRAAEALERVYAANLTPHVAALASHWRLAGAIGDEQKALTYARQAAQQAESVFAWETAAAHWQAALEALEARGEAAAEERCELLLALGEAQRRAGDHRAAQTTFVQAAEGSRAPELAERFAAAALGFVGIWADFETGATAKALLEEAADRLAAVESGLRATVLARLAMVTLSLPDAAWLPHTLGPVQELGREAIAMARRVGDTAALAQALNSHVAMIWLPEHLVEASAIASEIVELADAAGDLESALEGHWWRLVFVLELGDREAVDSEIVHMDRLVAALRQPFYDWLGLFTHAMLTLLEGHIAESGLLIEEALRVGQRSRGQLLSARIHRHQLLALRLHQAPFLERWAATQDECASLEAELRETDEQTRLALLYIEQGREDEARHRLAVLVSNDFYGNWVGSPGPISMAAEVCAALGELDHAAGFYSLLEPYAERMAVMNHYASSCRGPIALYLGILATALGRWDAAEQHFDKSLALSARMRAWPSGARTLYEYGVMLLARRGRGDASRAQGLLRAAAEQYAAIGMVHHEQKARALLADRRVAAARSAGAYPDGLSEREVEVLRLAAAGRSNPEIAGALVISRNTVLRHMNHIFAKTGAGNRVEAAAYANRHGLTEPEQR